MLCTAHTHTPMHPSQHASLETGLMVAVSRLSDSLTKSQNWFSCFHFTSLIIIETDRVSMFVSQPLNNTMRPKRRCCRWQQEPEDRLHQHCCVCLLDSQSISVWSWHEIWYSPSARLVRKDNAIWWQAERGGETSPQRFVGNKRAHWIKHDVTRGPNRQIHTLLSAIISTAFINRPIWWGLLSSLFVLTCIFIWLQSLMSNDWLQMKVCINTVSAGSDYSY